MMLTLYEAVVRFEAVSKANRSRAESYNRGEDYELMKAKECEICADECEQVASWLTELLDRREADRWISVKERMPDDLEPVNITWINHEPEPYYKEIKDKPFTATGVYFNGQWYWWSTLCTDILAEYSHNFDDIIDTAIEITHWKPLPKPYESEDK